MILERIPFETKLMEINNPNSLLLLVAWHLLLHMYQLRNSQEPASKWQNVHKLSHQLIHFQALYFPRIH